MKHGMGSLTWDDGDQFIGEFFLDEKKSGTFRWKGGDSYTGDWKNGLMHGHGLYTYSNGRTFEGEWESGYKQGYGIFTWPNGDRYEGEFLRDEFNGLGVQIYADSRIFVGEWRANRKHGYGMMVLRGGERIRGLWHDNQLNGVAIVSEASGERFLVHYRDNEQESARTPLKRKADESEPLCCATQPPKWLPDDHYRKCFACDAPFTVITRRHHCRHCGIVFCGGCTSKKVAIMRMNISEPSRVCEECYLGILTTVDVESVREAASRRGVKCASPPSSLVFSSLALLQKPPSSSSSS
eukprot:TRINITY_DN3985_c0_g1_i1.p1 TRINITY_DN3985_c0_g1~~TRINITY_DN3985_c0_g1_i1.p1  ORF type:complete len:334 (+),score=96.59 TRINITY_DN3985_c0_g1_i1:115-1002(+)